MIELMVVMAIIVILAALAIPSLSGLTKMSSEGAARTALRSLFASARARVASTMQYVGIRFQQDKDGRMWAIMLQQPKPSNDFPNGCPKYDLNCTYLTFVAATDVEPIPLPKGVEMAFGDLGSAANPDAPALWSPGTTGNVEATTFTVVFSPAGQIVRRQVHVSQSRDEHSIGVFIKWDAVFNITSDLSGGKGLFRPDIVRVSTFTPSAATYPVTGAEDAVAFPSQTSIWVYERQQRVNAAAPFTGYIQRQGTLVPLNVYTGAPVNTRR